jgi:hypothetical protein
VPSISVIGVVNIPCKVSSVTCPESSASSGKAFNKFALVIAKCDNNAAIKGILLPPNFFLVFLFLEYFKLFVFFSIIPFTSTPFTSIRLFTSIHPPTRIIHFII